MTKEKHNSSTDENVEPAIDPCRLALDQAIEAGELDDIETGTWVAFNEDGLVGTDSDDIELARSLYKNGLNKNTILHQVGFGIPVYSVRSRYVESSKETIFHDNVAAIEAAIENGDFDELDDGTWIAFYDKKLFAQNADKAELRKELFQLSLKGTVLHQLGVPRRTIHFRSPRRTRKIS